MIIGGSKREVIGNIRAAAEEGDFHRKVELGDPSLTDAEREGIISSFLERRMSIGYKAGALGSRLFVNAAALMLNKSTALIGLENARKLEGGAIVTSNHFNQIDNTVVRYAMRKAGKGRLFTVIQDTNLAMDGWIGFLMNHADVIPLSPGGRYMESIFPDLLREVLEKDRLVLIYHEEEMWFNYRKPRPCRRGAYYYAAMLGVPILPCFTQMQETGKAENDEFMRLEYTMHILDPIFPDPGKTIRENSYRMMEKDYEARKAAYEDAYGMPLSYEFDISDIAGWRDR